MTIPSRESAGEELTHGLVRHPYIFFALVEKSKPFGWQSASLRAYCRQKMPGSLMR
jgi:hypothetical protein